MSLTEKSLSIRENTLGPDHPAVAQSLRCVAVGHISEDRYADAAALLVRSLAIHEKASEAEKPELALTLRDLALVRLEQGRNDEALSLYERSVELTKNAQQPNYGSLATCLNDIGRIYINQTNYEYAETVLNEAKSICEDKNVSAPELYPLIQLKIQTVRHRTGKGANIAAINEAIAKLKEIGNPGAQLGERLLEEIGA